LKVGLFFGSFNPIHIGHLIIANTIVQSDTVDQVWFVVSPQNPFKKSGSLVHEFDRLDMVRAAIADNYLLQASDIEFGMDRPSYTADTLAYLSQKHSGISFSVIMGEDNLRNFPKWKNYAYILEAYGLIVYPRPQAEASEIKNHPQVQMVDAPKIDISATFIRRQIALGRSIKYLVTDHVEELINSRRLYSSTK